MDFQEMVRSEYIFIFAQRIMVLVLILPKNYNYMNYYFVINKGGYSELRLQEEFWELQELGSCSKDYLYEIKNNLEKVLNGNLLTYSFGYEVYSIQCNQIMSSVIDTFDNWKELYKLPTSEIHQLISDLLHTKIS
jgi:hypothetical protein